jgi:hypothetical protein
MWAQLLNTALGIWLTAAPDVIGFGGAAAAHHHILGPLVASSAFVAVWEVLRPIRWLTVLFGFWLLLAPWPFDFTPDAAVNSIVVGLLLIVFGRVGDGVTQKYGGGWSALAAGREH